jgi:hypothetical protein
LTHASLKENKANEAKPSKTPFVVRSKAMYWISFESKKQLRSPG